MKTTKRASVLTLIVAVLVVIAILGLTGAASGQPQTSSEPVWYYNGSPELPEVLATIGAENAECCWYYYGSPELPQVLQAIKAGTLASL